MNVSSLRDLSLYKRHFVAGATRDQIADYALVDDTERGEER